VFRDFEPVNFVVGCAHVRQAVEVENR
jgi:hypothetical protein